MQTSRVSLETWLNLFALDLLVVLLVVLVIYMVITPMFPFDLYVNVAESTSATPSPDSEEDLTINLPIPDQIIVENVAIPSSMLEQRLASAWRDRGRVRIRPARDVPFGDVRRVVQAAQRVGYTRVTVVVRAPRSYSSERVSVPCGGTSPLTQCAPRHRS
ncbi:MAG: ExbD/TolR family protein [Thermoanaerobaculia bacterium]